MLIELFSLLFPLYAKISKGFGTYGQQFALFFLLATWLSFMCQFILIGAVFNKMRLGTPTDEGIVAAAASRQPRAQGPCRGDRRGEAQGVVARPGSWVR